MRHMMQRGVYGLGGFLKASKARLELKMFKLWTAGGSFLLKQNLGDEYNPLQGLPESVFINTRLRSPQPGSQLRIQITLYIVISTRN